MGASGPGSWRGSSWARPRRFFLAGVWLCCLLWGISRASAIELTVSSEDVSLFWTLSERLVLQSAASSEAWRAQEQRLIGLEASNTKLTSESEGLRIELGTLRAELVALRQTSARALATSKLLSMELATAESSARESSAMLDSSKSSFDEYSREMKDQVLTLEGQVKAWRIVAGGAIGLAVVVLIVAIAT